MNWDGFMDIIRAGKPKYDSGNVPARNVDLKSVYVNIKGWQTWEYQNYPLTKREADLLLEMLEPLFGGSK